MNILITGATGTIGNHLIRRILEKYPQIRMSVLTRDKFKARFKKDIKVFEWDPYNDYIEPGALNGITHIIHLAGETVAENNWSKSKKKRIIDSRVIPTQFLKETVASKGIKIKFICASAIGVYGDRDNETLTTQSEYGNDFLAQVCKSWESTALSSYNNQDSYVLRIGIVLTTKGGALKRMLPLFNKNLGAIVASGDQFMSWIHIDDLVDQILFLTHNSFDNKIFNGVSSTPVTNREFAETLAKVIDKKLYLKVPNFALKALFGDMSKIMTNSQRVIPDGFMQTNFKLKYPNLKEALIDIIKHDK